MHDLKSALAECFLVASETDPRSLSKAELALLDQLDDRAFEIMDALITWHDECGPAARAAIARAMRI
jgi:hypothetical protein